jgi:glycosyltransferase involved in cell wall biosynthesis
MTTPLISVVSPVYRAEGIIDELVSQVSKSLSELTDSFEIVLVEDGGPDNSWGKISRNFGQHYAITAGIEQSTGSYVIVMDCDLQDDPKSIKLIIGKLKEGYDVVFTKRKKRSHSFIKNKMSALYNFVIGVIGDKKYDIDGGSMLGASRKACDAYLKLKDKDRLYVQMFKWIGFRHCYLEVPHNPRFEGESTYTFVKMLSLAMQGVTSHSTKLLKLSIYAGFSIALMAFLAGIAIIILYFTMGFSPGWPSIFVAIAFATGLILMSNGVLGIYIGKTFEQSKDRPLYIIEEKLNFKTSEF